MAGTVEKIGMTISILRIVKRWSQSDLAAAAGVTNSAISDYERGKVDPQTQTLHKIMLALGLRLSALDQTYGFIEMIQAQMTGASSPVRASQGLSVVTVMREPEERMFAEIAEIASEGSRFLSHLLRFALEILVRAVPAKA
jgi:transcriptional regulator with XRE-family HTH domain